MKTKLVITLLAMLVGLVIAALGETKLYTPSDIQFLRLQVKQRDAQLAQRDLQAAQQKFQQAILDLTQEAERVKLENKWDAKTQFDPNNLVFSAPPPEKPAPASEKKP